MSNDPTDPARDARGGVLPGYVRYPVIVVLAGAGLIGVVVVIYDAGWLPIAGPFAAVVIAAVIVYVVMWWRARRLRRLSTSAAEQLRALTAALTEERALAAPARPTRASDASLDQARTQAEGALQQLAWGHEQGAVPLLVDLGDVARRDWADEAPLSRQVADLDDTATELERVVRRMLETAARRRSS